MKRLLLFTAVLLGLVTAVPLQSVSAERYLQAHDSKNLWLKEGSYAAPWEVMANNAQGVNGVTGTASRIAFTDNNGIFWLKDAKTAPWVAMASNVREGAVSGDKIYIVTRDNLLYAKAGDYRTQWTLLRSNTRNVKASPNRVIAVADYDGSAAASLLIKDGGLGATWALLAKPYSTDSGGYKAPDFSVSDTRIAYVPTNFSGVFVKEGDYRSAWRSDLWTNTSSRIAFGIDVSAKRFCINSVIDAAIIAFCKDGPFTSPWVQVRNNAVTSDITDTKIATQDTGSENINILDGTLALNSGWQIIDDNGWLVFSK